MNGAVAKYAATRAAPSSRSARKNSTMLAPYDTAPRRRPSRAAGAAGSLSPMLKASTSMTTPPAIPFSRPRATGSRSDSRWLIFVSKDQDRQASATAPTPIQSAPSCPER